jgi:endonuclease YncB( thermonuclease family)
MRSILAGGLLVLIVSLTGLNTASAGDSFYGKVVEVKNADLVTLDNGSAKFDIRIIGIDVPREGPNAARAKEFVTRLLLGKNARARVEGRRRTNEMVGQLLTDDKEIGIKDVGVEMLKAGLARRRQGKDTDFGYKYNELTTAEREAREARRGLWAR